MAEENNNMDKELLYRQYQLYCQMKENFVDRNFMTNKFYICLIVAIFVIMFFTIDITFAYNISANLIMAFIGMAVSFFWWSNADAYNILIKVKLKHVIDEIEKQLPVQMHLMEMKNFAAYKKANKVFIFSDMQKGIAISMIILFFVLFLIEFVKPITVIIYGSVADYSAMAL